jgi:ribosomal protein S18 acetylase RimI-like enzyme
MYIDQRLQEWSRRLNIGTLRAANNSGRHMQLLVAALLVAPAAALNALSTTPAALFAPRVHRVRLARRDEIWSIAGLLDASFAAKTAERSPWEALVARGRLALDLERRLTPWDWCRHLQFVAEDLTSNRIVGFAELWAENAAACGVSDAVTPQPVVFNLCVATSARRQGIASQLLAQCEAGAAEWGEPGLYLKVEVENLGALDLYRRCGFEELGMRDPAEMEAWMARWKGGRRPLRLMRKPVSCSPPVGAAVLLSSAIAEINSNSTRGGSPPVPVAPASPPRFSELEVSLDRVREYEARGAGGQAYLWFALLCLRNARLLAPAYGALAGASGMLGFVTYSIIAEMARSP